MTLLILALALAADAFAAALIQGVAARANAVPTALRCGAAFGCAQGVMPLIGAGLGASIQTQVAAIAPWIAFSVLAFLGAKLIKEGLTHGPEDVVPAQPARGWALAALAIATSLDAAAAGLTFGPLGMEPLGAAVVIGAVTGVVCALGGLIGARVGPQLGAWGDILGGICLLGVGVKVLLDHGALPAP